MFTGSTVVLTGVGNPGQVGEVVARAFADLGASTVLVGRSAENAQARAKALTDAGLVARGYGCDLSSADDVARLAKEIAANHGDRVHALVCMAGGFGMSGPVAESTDEVWNRMMAINLDTARLTSRAFLPLVRSANGSIVFFASQAVLPGSNGKNMSAYAAAKSGVVALMRAIAAEERGNGVRANALAPASIRTATNESTMGSDVRYVEREEVAAAVTFLCSSAASAITGELLPLS